MVISTGLDVLSDLCGENICVSVFYGQYWANAAKS
jgi:hypothetical protein